MKSPMVTNLAIPNKEGYSELQVLRSNAGYYIGTMYTNVEEDGTSWESPGSRDSGYYANEEDAAHALSAIKLMGDETAALVLRQNP